MYKGLTKTSFVCCRCDIFSKQSCSSWRVCMLVRALNVKSIGGGWPGIQFQSLSTALTPAISHSPLFSSIPSFTKRSLSTSRWMCVQHTSSFLILRRLYASFFSAVQLSEVSTRFKHFQEVNVSIQLSLSLSYISYLKKVFLFHK